MPPTWRRWFTAARSPGVRCERSGARRSVAVFCRMAVISAGARVGAGAGGETGAAGSAAPRSVAPSEGKEGEEAELSFSFPFAFACAKR